ncbi:MAG: pyridoxamine 5'-phosphate oxidase family protein [Chloroflexota bacterium]|nr:MAG: pyridoxamine 5'-phosphate oxidase [Chloroflexota bacterium]
MTVRSTQPPSPARPNFAKGYGISTSPDGLMSWEWVDQQMTRARNYWIGSTRPNGAPHIAPVWGVWLDGALYFGGDSQARRTRNLLADPRVVAHLESGDEVVIIEGVVERVMDSELIGRIERANATKYGMPEPDPDATPDPTAVVWFRVVPHVVFAWLERDYPRTATRWVFE